jgi:hypothetical protein
MAANALGFHSFGALFAHSRDIPHGLRVHGGFVAPHGISKRKACHGFVTLRLVSRTRTVAKTRVRLDRGCEFDATLRVRSGKPRRLRMSIRFEGNAAVLPHVLGPLGFAR